MSEFQYYEFRALDRSLTQEEMDEVQELSSRARVTSMSAVFTYNYGDFKGDAKKVVDRYFDMMLYTSNFGAKELYFKLPKSLVNVEALRAYTHKNDCAVEVIPTKNSVLVCLSWSSEEFEHDFIEDEDVAVLVSKLLPLREEIILEDYRSLFLTWLANYSGDDDDSKIESLPVPPNLHKLSPALKALVDFFCINPEDIKKFAKKSKKIDTTKVGSLDETFLNQLTREDMQFFLKKVLDGDPLVSVELKKRLKEFRI